jgi:hypothetical protein
VSVCLLFISDGRREYLAPVWASIAAMIPPVDRTICVDDADHRLGFAGAVAEGWRRARATGAEWILHVEQDFVFEAPVPLVRMIGVLERHPHLVQMSLLRQAVNSEELAAGGIVELRGHDMAEVRDGEDVWLEHALWWTTNPSLYRMSLTERGWPQESESEGKFSGRLFAERPEARSGIWGAKTDPPRVRHIGHRAGHGY